MSANKQVRFAGNNTSGLPFIGGAAGFADNGQGGTSFSGNQRNIFITVVGTGTVTVYGSIQDAGKEVDFSAPSTIDNSYAVMELKDYSVVGSAAYVLSAVVAGETKIFELNTNLVTHFGIERDAATVDVLVTVTDNQ